MKGIGSSCVEEGSSCSKHGVESKCGVLGKRTSASASTNTRHETKFFFYFLALYQNLNSKPKSTLINRKNSTRVLP